MAEGESPPEHLQSENTRRSQKATSLGYPGFICHDCGRTFNERTGTAFNYLQFPTDIVLLVVVWRVLAEELIQRLW